MDVLEVSSTKSLVFQLLVTLDFWLYKSLDSCLFKFLYHSCSRPINRHLACHCKLTWKKYNLHSFSSLIYLSCYNIYIIRYQHDWLKRFWGQICLKYWRKICLRIWRAIYLSFNPDKVCISLIKGVHDLSVHKFNICLRIESFAFVTCYVTHVQIL